LFEFIVDVFLDIVVVADTRVDVEEITYCTDFVVLRESDSMYVWLFCNHCIIS